MSTRAPPATSLSTAERDPLFASLQRLRRKRRKARSKSSSAADGGRSGSALVRQHSKLPRVDVIFNPVSGHGDTSFQSSAIKAALSKGYHDVHLHETTVDVDAASLAAAAIRDGAEILVASGGDGTVTAVAAAVRKHVHGEWVPSAAREQDDAEAFDGVCGNSEKPGGHVARGRGGAGVDSIRLGIIPRGTANAFCGAVGIPMRVSSAARLVNRATARRVDVAMVNGESPMMLLCGIGLEAEAVSRADRSLKTRFGSAAYFLAGLTSVAQQKTFTVSLILHDARQVRRVGRADMELASKKVVLHGADVTAVTVANSAPATCVLAQGIGRVSPDDGLLDVVCVAPHGRLSMISAMFAMLWSGFVGQRVARGDIYGMRARRVEVRCEPSQRVVVDGEDCGRTPVVIELAEDEGRRQICVVAPKPGAISRRRRRLGRALVRGLRNLRGVLVLGLVVWSTKRVRGERNRDG